MIVVIADDLTGAGEIGGIGLACGFKVELQRRFCPQTDARLLVIDTDSRPFPPQKAGRVIRDVVLQLKDSGLPVEWIYKKTDSVLRGPVAGELEALREVMGADRVLLVPANPSKGRIVRNGHYLINGKPLHETDFANDPEYPAMTSEVLKLPSLSGSGQIHLLKSDQPFLGKGIVLGQAETAEDLSRWSGKLNTQTIPAGAGEFFEAILRNKGFSKKTIADEKEYRLEGNALFVCGSSSDSSSQALRKAETLGAAVCRMPEALFRSDCSADKCCRPWCDRILESFKNNHLVIMAVDRPAVGNPAFAEKLRDIMAKAVQSVFREICLKELFVEGGATAARIVDCFGWSRFEPCDQLAPGVVRMKVLESGTIYLTMKPGSYPWPEVIWNIFSKGYRHAP